MVLRDGHLSIAANWLGSKALKFHWCKSGQFILEAILFGDYYTQVHINWWIRVSMCVCIALPGWG